MTRAPTARQLGLLRKMQEGGTLEMHSTWGCNLYKPGETPHGLPGYQSGGPLPTRYTRATVDGLESRGLIEAGKPEWEHGVPTLYGAYCRLYHLTDEGRAWP